MSSPVDLLLKFLRLEKDRGFDNRAVLGGLDKFIPTWKITPESDTLSKEVIQEVCSILQRYPELDIEGRTESIEKIVQMIHGVTTVDQPAPTFSGIPANNQHRNPPLREKIHRNIDAESPHPKAKVGGVIPEKPVGLEAKLTVLPGIGTKNAQSLDQLGLKTLEDLLFYFPRRYDDYSTMKQINHLAYGDVLSVLGTVKSINHRPIKDSHRSMTEVIVTDGTGSLRVTWFNQPWLEKTMQPGFQMVLSGKVDAYLGRLCMNNPEWEPVEQEHLHTNRIVPVYPSTAGVSQRMLRRMLQQTVSFWASRISDFMPEDIRKAGNLVTLSEAINQVHFPDNISKLTNARERLAFDEIFLIQLGVLRQKLAWQSNTAKKYPTSDEWLDTQIKRFPYTLTSAQLRVIGEIREDFQSGRPMDRLLQGDVGSGKTFVAAIAAAMIAQYDAQVAFMAPTSILADQHYRNLTTLFLDSGDDASRVFKPGEIRLMVGDTSESEKQEIRNGLEDGSIKLIIGTHALIEEPVKFKHLQLAIIDEQHRFGVAQRATLRAKGDNPHLLVMTATPIPRSLALTVYGDLDLSIIDEMPPGRQTVETHILRSVERERALSFIHSQVGNGRQAFIIYPLVEEGEKEEVLAAVQQRDRLQKEVFPHLEVGLLHGRMKPEEKDRVMADFRSQKFPILVSTSVIEVGVDVPNATVMMIEGANRFGLAQLHQLRGRVGRGEDQSFCLLIPDKDDAVENERLKAMEETNDGFVLAERDLDQRGPGDFLGTRQAGFADLKLANLTNLKLIEKARQFAQNVFTKDPQLSDPNNLPLLNRLNSFWKTGQGDVS